MRVRYDEQVDALYIRLKETSYHESDEIKEGFIVDYDKAKKIFHEEDKKFWDNEPVSHQV